MGIVWKIVDIDTMRMGRELVWIKNFNFFLGSFVSLFSIPSDSGVRRNLVQLRRLDVEAEGGESHPLVAGNYFQPAFAFEMSEYLPNSLFGLRSMRRSKVIERSARATEFIRSQIKQNSNECTFYGRS